MSKRVASSSLNNFRITGEIDELSPPIKNGLVTHVNFQGGLSYNRTLNGCKVLRIGMANGGHSSGTLVDEGCILTDMIYSNQTDVITNFNKLTDVQLSSYDIIYVNLSAWGISSDIYNRIYHIINNLGISVISDGNDTHTNKYVLEVTDLDNQQANVVYNDFISSLQSIKRLEYADNRVYITKLSKKAHTIATIGNKYTMAYYVQEKGGYVHTQNKLFTNSEMVEICKFLASKSYGKVSITDTIKFNADGAMMMRGKNLWDSGIITSSHAELKKKILPNVPWGRNTDYDVYTFTPKNGLVYCKVEDKSTVYPIGTRFIFGAWCYIEPNCNISDNIALVGEDGTKGSKLYDINKKGQWQYIQISSISTSVGFTFLLYPGHSSSSTWTSGNIYFTNPVIYATNDRDSIDFSKGDYNGSVELLGSETKNYTIIIKHRIIDGCEIAPNATNYKCFEVYDKNTDKAIFYSDYKQPSGINSPWVGHDNFIGNTEVGWHWHQRQEYMPSKGKEQYIILCKEGNRIYLNTIVDGSVYTSYLTYTNTELINFVFKKIKFLDSAFKTLSDVYVYNIALTMDEIKLNFLSKNPLSINIDGNLNGKEILEGIVDENEAITYFPLSTSSENKSGTKYALSDTNVIYEENQAIVSKHELVNMFTMDKAMGQWSTITKSINHINVIIDKNSKIYSGMMISNSNNSIKLEANTEYMVEFDYTSDIALKLLYDINCNILGVGGNDHWSNREYDNKYNTSNAFITEPGKWKKFRIYYKTLPDVVYSHSSDVIGIHDVAQEAVSFKIKNIVFRKAIRKNMDIPYIQNKLSPSSGIRFNLYRDIGLDWSGNWTIAYIKRNHFMALDGNTTHSNWCIDSIGCNGNNVGNNYCYWGRVSDSYNLTLRGGSSSSLDSIDNFLAGYHIVIVTKNGNSITYRYIPEKGMSKMISATNTVSASNAFVTQYGYDLILGGFDNIHITGCSSYRDLIVAKRCLSDEEINKYIKTFFKSDIKSLKINNEIIENDTL